MIDPKLNELPADTAGDAQKVPESELTGEQRAQRLRHSREGLSINDTIAGGANLSVGSRGLEVSGIETGSGAGAGLTSSTPTRSSSPAPNIVPPARGSGTTPRSTSALTQDTSPDLGTQTAGGTSEEISRRAYRCWQQRGCPHGSPELDWQRAEEELREERRKGRTTSASV